jgi:hypothetical protein
LTWILVIVIAFGSGQEHGVVTPIPGYKSKDACNMAAKEAYDNSRLAYMTAFCIPAP